MQLSAVQDTLSKQVAKQLIAGYSLSDVIDFACENFDGVTAEQVVETAASWFQSASQEDDDFRAGWCAEAYKELYRKMIEVGDYAGAKSCVQEILAFSERTTGKRSNA